MKRYHKVTKIVERTDLTSSRNLWQINYDHSKILFFVYYS